MASKSLKPRKKLIKKGFVSFMFNMLGRAIRACYRLDGRVKEEFDDFPDGTAIRMAVLPDGPSIVFRKEQDNIAVYRDYNDVCDLDIRFKSIESVLMAVTAEKSVAVCYAEQRFAVYGDLAYAAAFVRIMNIVEVYIYPRIWMTYLFNNNPPKRERSQFRFYLSTIFGKLGR